MLISGTHGQFTLMQVLCERVDPIDKRGKRRRDGRSVSLSRVIVLQT